MSRARRVGLVTCERLPEPDPDVAVLVERLRRHGLEVEMLSWDGLENDAGRFDLCVLKSPWNYHLAPDRFAAWLDAAARRTQLWNPLPVVRWNMHKRYLADLAERGVPVVPTRWLDRGSRVDLGALVASAGWSDLVVKPSISASAHRTRRFGGEDLAAAQAFLDALLGAGDAMVQPYLPGFEQAGERSLTWVDGVLTHVVHRPPLLARGRSAPPEQAAIAADEAVLAARAVAAVAADCLYARVDLVRDPDVGLVLSELELIEPLLCLHRDEGALARFAAAVAARAGG